MASSGSLSADRKAGTACDDPRWETIRFANANCGDRYLYVVGTPEISVVGVVVVVVVDAASYHFCHAVASVSVPLKINFNGFEQSHQGRAPPE